MIAFTSVSLSLWESTNTRQSVKMLVMCMLREIRNIKKKR